jgi:pimeloyl-ACP methyl ester carboxylesterase
MRRLLLLTVAVVLSGQDAELALRTLVGYNTMRASLPLTPEKKAQAASLAEQAQAASREGKFGEAIRHLHHGTAIMQGTEWTLETELAAGLQGKVDDAIADPGQKLQLILTPLYKPAQPVQASLKVFLRRAAPGALPVPLAGDLQISSGGLPARISIQLPPDAAGDYELVAVVGEAKTAAQRKAVPIHVASLTEAAAQLSGRLEKISNPTAAYALTRYREAERGVGSPHKIDFAKSFAEAQKLLDAVAAGKDPFAGRTGDLKKAYLSAVDQTLQPYRLFVPASYDAAKAAPLVIALHGMGGNENSMFDGYGGTGALQREAEKRGFLVVCPKGRDTASMYRGAAETDVLDVLAEVQRDYNVDAKRIYMMGHSMGGYGTWSIAMKYPEKFAALGPIAGGGDPRGMEKIKAIPHFVVHGDNDKTVPVTQSRGMVEAGRKLGMKIEYVEVPGGSHVDIAVPNFGPMFAFFAGQARD